MEYDNFMANHDCPINHSGSASSKEQSGVLTGFKRSIGEVRYTPYIGDGDSVLFQFMYRRFLGGDLNFKERVWVMSKNDLAHAY